MVKSDYREAVPKHHGTMTSSGTANELAGLPSPFLLGGALNHSTMSNATNFHIKTFVLTRYDK